jgi:hypothetical protein
MLLLLQSARPVYSSMLMPSGYIEGDMSDEVFLLWFVYFARYYGITKTGD